MGSQGNLLIVAHTGNQQIVLDSAEPVVRIERLDTLGESRGIGVLKIPQLGSGLIPIVVIVVVVDSSLSDLL